MTRNYYDQRVVRTEDEALAIAEENEWDLVSCTRPVRFGPLKAVFYTRPYGYTLAQEEAMARVMND